MAKFNLRGKKDPTEQPNYDPFGGNGFSDCTGSQGTYSVDPTNHVEQFFVDPDIYYTITIGQSEVTSRREKEISAGGKVIKIQLPDYVISGNSYTYEGKGNLGTYGQRGNLYLTIIVEPDTPTPSKPKWLWIIGITAIVAVVAIVAVILLSGFRKKPMQVEDSPKSGNVFCNHQWSAPTCTQAEKCVKCGKTGTLSPGHVWSNATCTKGKTCTTCGLVSGSALAHTWTGGSCTQSAICSVCGVAGDAAIGHQWTQATCTQDQTCTVCGTIGNRASGHNWTEATWDIPKTCLVCGKTEGSVKPKKMATDIVAYVKASSTYTGDRASHDPNNLNDGRNDTNWTEGVDGSGTGEYVEFVFYQDYLLSGITINSGNHYSKDYYKMNNRPKKITLSFADGSSQSFTLEDNMAQYTLTIDNPVITDTMRLTINSVYAGSKYDDTVISEVSFVAFE